MNSIVHIQLQKELGRLVKQHEDVLISNNGGQQKRVKSCGMLVADNE